MARLCWASLSSFPDGTGWSLVSWRKARRRFQTERVSASAAGLLGLESFMRAVSSCRRFTLSFVSYFHSFGCAALVGAQGEFQRRDLRSC